MLCLKSGQMSASGQIRRGAPEFQDIAAIRFMLHCSICTHIGQWVRRKIYLTIRKLMFLIC
ncbi:hypothetical protein CV103_10845 [Sphingomonas fennica]|uniref:Uncharacterized protein n=1 Tax=Edaphosphingomonas fennica TaxID=114404 RepID=A0A2T4HYI7_9SPHN|nr:hypothetical protein CV103_10845 [Sphingomonas fennica]